jgi:hypothetical protein
VAAPFTDQQKRTLTAVLDEIVPPSADGRLPGAGEAGIVDFIVDAVEKNPDLRPALVDGLDALGEFCDVPKQERAQVLRELADRVPAFLPGLTYQTYLGYYQHPRVLEGLGVPGRPPHPEGYELEMGDLGLLDAVRARPKLFRD